MDNQSSGAEKAARAAGAANIARGAAYGGLYGAAAEAVKSFFPEIVKGGVILLFVIILGPLLIFTALPNILFGFDSATAPDIVDFTASARELEAIYQGIDGKNQSIIDKLVDSILPDFMTDDVPDYEDYEVKKTLGNVNNYWLIAIMSAGHFTTTGHFIVLRGITEEGNVLVADPASVKRSSKEWPLGIITNEAATRAGAGGPFWVFSN